MTSQGAFKELSDQDAQKLGDNFLFIPMDSRLPRMLVSKTDLSAEKIKLIEAAMKSQTIYQVQITEWQEGSSYAKGEIMQTLGDPSHLDVLMQAKLVDYGIDTTDLEHTTADLPGADFVMPADEIAKRRDFRNKCVFSIDPATARDLDDALHVEKMQNGNYEVGVHIADVSYFVKPNSSVDQV